VQTLTLGVVLPLSGPDGQLGVAMERGVELAVRQNRVPAKGYQFAVSKVDEASATVGHDVSALAADKTVTGVIGPLESTTAGTLAPLVEQQHLATISMGVLLSSLTQPTPAEPDGVSYPSLGSNGGVLAVFQLVPAAVVAKEAAAVAVAPSSAKGLGAHSIFVVGDGTPAGQQLSTAFVQALGSAGGSSVGTATVTPGDTQSAQVAAIAIIRADPDAVFYAGGTQAGAALRAALSLTGAPQMTILTTAPIAANPGWSADVGQSAAAANTLAVLPAQPAANSTSAMAFAAAYHTAFGADAPPQAAMAYDAAMDEIAAVKGLLAAGKQVTRAAVLARVASTPYSGVTGTLAFDANGAPKTQPAYGVYSCDATGTWKQIATKQG
jgi:branched-chain amino acid transport system substrate-binding protein